MNDEEYNIYKDGRIIRKLSGSTSFDEYTKQVLDSWHGDITGITYNGASADDYIGGSTWGNDNDLSEAQIKFINTLLKTTDFKITPPGVELLTKILDNGSYTINEAGELNKIRDRYIIWKSKN